MTTVQIFFRTSYVFAMIGGLVAVGAGWLNAQPDDGGGANIGAGLLFILATGLMAGAIITWIVGLISRSTAKGGRKEVRAAPREA